MQGIRLDINRLPEARSDDRAGPMRRAQAGGSNLNLHPFKKGIAAEAARALPRTRLLEMMTARLAGGRGRGNAPAPNNLFASEGARFPPPRSPICFLEWGIHAGRTDGIETSRKKAARNRG